MICRFKIFSIGMLVISIFGVRNADAMEREQSAQKIFTGYDLVRRHFFSKPLSLAPDYAHAHGLFCSGHEGRAISEPIRRMIETFEQNTADSLIAQDFVQKAQQFKRQQFLTAYLNGTCSNNCGGLSGSLKVIEAANTMLNIARSLPCPVLQEELMANAFGDILSKFKALVLSGNHKLSFKDPGSFRTLCTAIQFDEEKGIIDALKEKKDLESQYAYAQCLLNGQGVEKNIDKAVRLYAKICTNTLCPQEIKALCMDVLRSQARQGSCVALQELLLICVGNEDAKIELNQWFSFLYNKTWSEQQTYLAYFSQDSCYNRLKEVSNMFDFQGAYLCALVAEYRVGHMQKVEDKKAALSDLMMFFDCIKDDNALLPERSCKLPLVIGRFCDQLGDRESAIKLYEIGRSRQCLSCLRELGFMHVHHPEDQAEIKRGIIMLRLAADKGSASAQLGLAEYYSGYFEFDCKGESINSEDLVLAYKYVNMALAAEPHNLRAQYLLAQILFDHGGKFGIPVDNARALSLFEAAASGGHSIEPIHYVLLGVTCYKNKNFVHARTWFEKVHNLEIAQFCNAVIALILEVPEKPCAKNACYNAIEANLSNIFALSNTDPKIYSDILENDILVNVLKKFSSEGQERARIILSRLVCTMPKDNFFRITHASSVAYLQEMADKKNPSACQCLGSLLIDGLIVKKDFEKAFELLAFVAKNKETPEHVLHLAIVNLAGLTSKASGKVVMNAATLYQKLLIKLRSDLIKKKRLAIPKDADGDEEKLAEDGNEFAMLNVARKYMLEFQSKTADSRLLPKCIHYLESAAERGNHYALFILSSGTLAGRSRQLKPTLREKIIKKIIRDMSSDNPLKTDKLYSKALLAMISQNWDLASSLFEKLNEKYTLPRLLLVAANIQFIALKNIRYSMDLVINALKKAAEQNEKLDDVCSHFILQDMYAILQSNAGTDSNYGIFLQVLEKLFNDFAYENMKPVTK